jgi:hypothetical protein
MPPGPINAYTTPPLSDRSPADLLRPRVDGGRAPDPISAGRLAATKRLHGVERTVTDWHGYAGLSVTRCVLTGGKSVDKAARDFGARSELERR